MQYFKNILVALDFQTDEQAEINHGIKLALLHQAKITFISILPNLTQEVTEISAMSPKDKQALRINKLTEQLEDIAVNLREQHIHVSTLVKIGNPSIEIIKHILYDKHDLLIIGERRKKGFKSKLFTNTATQLLRKSPCPVWAINHTHTHHYTTVMASIDVHAERLEANHQFNINILKKAAALAHLNTCRLLILNSAPNESLIQEHRTRITQLLDTCDIVTDEQYILTLHGDATQVIPQITEEYQVDLLVMGMLSRTGILGFFIGNIAEKIQNNVASSLFVIKPEEFESPIKLDAKTSPL